MTLIVALRGKDGIVAAADSRGTFGDPRGVTAQNDSQQKVHIVSGHVALLMSGPGELGAQLIADIVQIIQAQGTDGATNVMAIVRATARQRYAEWFPHLPVAVLPGVPQMARPDLALIVAGYDADGAGAYKLPRLYQTVSALDFPPMLHEYGFALAGVAQYALYLLNRLYEPDRSLSDLASLAVYVIKETASQDGKVGGPVRVVTVTPAKGGVALSEEDVHKLHASNEERGAALRKSFYTSK